MSTGQPAHQAAPHRGPRAITRHQTVIAVIATLGGFLFGYDTGVISGALIYISRDLAMSATQQGLVVSLLLVGAAFGATFGGKLSDRIGRKPTIRAAAVVFVLGTLGCAFSPTAEALIACRAVLGLAVGCVSATVPPYISEIAPTERRGRLVNQNELMIVTGQLVAYVVNAVVIQVVSGDVSWRWMLGAAVIPAVLLLAGMAFVPETPRWLVQRGRYGAAERVLRTIRDPQTVAEDLTLMREVAHRPHEHEGRSGWVYLRARWVRMLFLIGCGVALCQQITGLNSIIYYAPTILEQTGLGDDASVTASIAVGAVGVIGVAVGMHLVGRVNRRPMIITGLVTTTASLLVLSLLFQLPDSTARSYVILAFMVVFVAFQQCFISTVTWLMLSEIFPMKIRGFATGVVVFFLWIVNFAVSLLFPILSDGVGPTWTFLTFMVFGLAMLVFAVTSLPETRGRPLEAIERGFRERYST